MAKFPPKMPKSKNHSKNPTINLSTTKYKGDVCHLLMCQQCPESNFYQDSVTHDFKFKDNGPGFSILCAKNSIITQTGDNDLAGRRDYIYISFRCENCGKYSKVIFQQHKGMTYLTLC